MAQDPESKPKAVRDALRDLGVDSVDEFIVVANSVSVVCCCCHKVSRVRLPEIAFMDGEVKLSLSRASPTMAYGLEQLALAILKDYDFLVVQGKEHCVVWITGPGLGTAFVVTCANCLAKLLICYRAGNLMDVERITGSSDRFAALIRRIRSRIAPSTVGRSGCGDHERQVVSALHRAEERLTKGERSLEADGTNWHEKGRKELEVGRYKEAIACFDRALAINPNVAPVWLDKGVALSRSGAAAEASVCYTKSLELNPSDAIAWFDKGNTLRKMGRTSEAVECFDRAIAINRTDPDVWVNKGLALESLGRVKDALECYSTALGLNQALVEAWLNKGCLLGNGGELRGALECFDKVLALNPIDADASFGKAATLLKLRNLDEAKAALERFVEAAERGDARREQALKLIGQLAVLPANHHAGDGSCAQPDAQRNTR